MNAAEVATTLLQRPSEPREIAQALRYLIDLVGSEQIVLGSDSPFDMGDDDPAGMLGQVPQLSGVDRENICSRNAMRLLGE